MTIRLEGRGSCHGAKQHMIEIIFMQNNNFFKFFFFPQHFLSLSTFLQRYNFGNIKVGKRGEILELLYSYRFNRWLKTRKNHEIVTLSFDRNCYEIFYFILFFYPSRLVGDYREKIKNCTQIIPFVKNTLTLEFIRNLIGTHTNFTSKTKK